MTFFFFGFAFSVLCVCNWLCTHLNFLSELLIWKRHTGCTDNSDWPVLIIQPWGPFWPGQDLSPSTSRTCTSSAPEHIHKEPVAVCSFPAFPSTLRSVLSPTGRLHSPAAALRGRHPSSDPYLAKMTPMGLADHLQKVFHSQGGRNWIPCSFLFERHNFTVC